MKKTGKILGIIAIVFFVMIAGSIITLWIMFPPQKIKALIVPQVEKILGREIIVEKAGISVFPVLGVSFGNVEIANTSRAGFSSEPFVKLDRFLVQIGVLSIFKGEPQIGKILLEKPFVCLEKDSSGSFNFEDIPILASKDTIQKDEKEDKGGFPVLPVPITLKTFKIENGSAIYIDKTTGQDFTIGDIDLDIAFLIDKSLKDINTSGELNVSQVSVKTKEISKPLTDLTITLSHDVNANLVDGTADINQLRLSFQKVYLNCTGKISGLNEKVDLDLRIVSDPIAIQDLLEEIPTEIVPAIAQLNASGIANCDIVVKGTLEDKEPFPVNGKLTLENCQIRYRTLPKTINGLNTSVSFTGNSLDIHDFRMRFGDNPINLKGSIQNFEQPLIDIALDARIDLDDVKDMIEVPQEASLGGIIEADVTAKGEVDPVDPSKLDVKGKTELKNVTVLWSPLLKPAVVNGEFNLSSKAIGENLDVSIGNSSLSMSASVSDYLSLLFSDSTKSLPRPNARFDLKAPLLNVDEIIAVKSDTQNTNGNKQDAGNTPLIAPLPGLDMKGTVTAGKIIYEGIKMENLKMSISVINDIADLNFNTGFSNGIISDIMNADLRNTRNISFSNKLTVKGIEINELLKSFGGFVQPKNPLNKELLNLQKSLYGKINLNCNLTGNGATPEDITKSLNGKITAGVNNGKISNSLILAKISDKIEKFISIDDINFRDLSTILLIADEKVLFEKLSIRSQSSGDWDAKGSVGFDAGLDMNITNKLTKGVSSKILSVQKSGKEALKGLFQGTKLGSAATNLIDDTGIPSDKDGRITVKLALSGTASEPKVSFDGFGEGDKSGTAIDKQVKTKVVEEVKETLMQKKQELENKLEEEKKKAEEELRKKAQEQKAEIDKEIKKQSETIQKQSEDVKKKAVNKLKKLF
ncbi:MAG TPA: AsmA family protein [Chitinispirillaceae bacterium]|nr:AsmA family protein [Chitinispirillaceae bacterium]